MTNEMWLVKFVTDGRVACVGWPLPMVPADSCRAGSIHVGSDRSRMALSEGEQLFPPVPTYISSSINATI